MIIKKYKAQTEKDAILLAKEDLGPDAIVMNVKTIKPKGLARLFKKTKVVKTFLLAFGLGMLISLVTIAVMKAIGMNGIKIDTSEFTEAGFIRAMNWIVFAIYFVWFGVQDLVLYLRMKTLKH